MWSFEMTSNMLKWSVDPFRDHCLNQYNIVPVIKKRILYVPRAIKIESQTGRASTTKGCSGVYPNRYINDERLIELLKEWCSSNEYEFVPWVNKSSTSIYDQIKIYSESDIIICTSGTDIINAWWCNDKQLIIEMTPPSEACGSLPAQYPLDFCLPFNSKSIQLLPNMFGDLRTHNEWGGVRGSGNIWVPIKTHVRNWDFVVAPRFTEHPCQQK